ncbi:MAG TPA: DNA repair protein RadA [Candidatus Limnocylindrales bacterium]|nr:DNA repair protein RadA [Candidatus Limnocylindrales bacterium]
MARPQSRFVCQSCGESFLRWEGQCRVCEGWNTLVETVVHEPTRSERSIARGRGAGAAGAESLASIVETDLPRLSLGIGELDRVLGGGLVPGSLVLVGGEPGIGKSTLLLQAAAGLTRGAGGGHVLYATGEESPAQVRMRAARLGLLTGPSAQGVRVIAEHDVGRIVDAARSERPGLVVVDSIQTATIDDLDGAAGSVGQVRESTLRLMDLAKGDGIAVILVGHVTKDGSIAGPKTLEHLVDAVVNLEGERYAALRLLRATKNRFGSTDEIGVFEMAETGLLEVADPARAFLADHGGSAPGSVVAPTLEGSRPLLVEVQALVSPTSYGNPSRKASGLDPNRLSLLIAVLGRRAGIALGSHDVYANLAGGLSVAEPALDLPLALALASSSRDRPIPASTVAIGEVGLLGELRAVVGLERRLREAARLGFERAIVPRPAARTAIPDIVGLEVVSVGTLRDAIEIALSDRPSIRGEAVPAMLG